MVKGSVYINGLIGNIPDVMKGITLMDVLSQVQRLKQHNADLQIIEIVINSEGGVVEEGDAMYDYFEELKDDYTINTKSAGAVSSIASKLFLVGEKRTMRKQDRMLIHNPWSDPVGNADLLEVAVEELRSIETRMVKFYHEKTGVEESALKSLMEGETVLSADQAKEFGFATDVVEVPMAYAYHNRETQEQKIEKETESFISKLLNMKNKNLKTAVAFLASLLTEDGTPVALDLMGQDGTILRSSAETMDALVGSTLTVVTPDGELPAPEGTHVLEDGSSLVVDANGIVTEVIAATTEPTPEEAMQAKVEALEGEKLKLAEQVAEMSEQLKVVKSPEFKENVMLMKEGIAEVEQAKDDLRKFKSHFNIPMNLTFDKFVETEEKQDVAVIAADRKASYKKKKSSIIVGA